MTHQTREAKTRSEEEVSKADPAFAAVYAKAE
jgi:hypothetical protein